MPKSTYYFQHQHITSNSQFLTTGITGSTDSSSGICSRKKIARKKKIAQFFFGGASFLLSKHSKKKKKKKILMTFTLQEGEFVSFVKYSTKIV